MNGAYPFPDGRTYVARTLVLLDDRQRLFGDQLELGASFTTGPVRHDLLAGFEIRSLTDRFTQDVAFLPPIDLLAPVETAQPPFATVPYLAQKGDSSALVLAPYLVDRLRFSPKLQAFVAARLDVLDYEDPPNATERDDTRFNPMLGLTFSPTTDLALHASWGTASAPPSTQVVGPREPEAELAGRARGASSPWRAARPRPASPSTSSSATTSRSPTRPGSRGRPATSARAGSRSISP